MKKWRVLLVVLCAMLASIGLFACKKDSAEDIANITKMEGGSNLTYTDNDTWDSILTSLKGKIKLTCRPAKGDAFVVKGEECDFDKTIAFDEAGHCKVGYYKITIKPTENNPKGLSREADVEIQHAFAAQGGREVCSYCAATKITAQEDAIIHYGTFHDTGSTYNNVPAEVYGEDGSNKQAFYNKKAANETNIKQFGEVKTVKGVSYTIPTLTVGRLEPGMSITVRGTAKTAYSEWGVEKDAGYYFPVIGIADRTLNNPAWDGGAPRTDFVGGGTSVFVRSEGWVLYDGIDSSHVDGSPLRMLSGLGTTNSGKGTGHNYGSHETANHESTEVLPGSYTQGQVPDPGSSAWKDWVVYSYGTISQTTAYSGETQVAFTWNYRKDKVIELIYDVNGVKLVGMIKVPDSSTGYYDTMLHGDYVDMHITSYERIETLTPKAFNVTVNRDNYYEGQTFNPDTLNASFKYEQTGDETSKYKVSLEDIYASTDPDADETQSTGWVSLKDNPVLGTYRKYKVEVIKGGETWRYTFDKSAINVVPNAIESVFGFDNGDFTNGNMLRGFTLGTDGTDITLTPVGDYLFAQTIPTSAYSQFTGTVTENHRFVSLKINKRALLNPITSVQYKDADNTPVPYAYSASDGTLVLALSKAGTVVVEGMQDSKTVFDFTKLRGFNATASMEQEFGSNGWALNNETNEVTVTFKVTNGDFTRVQIGDSRFEEYDFTALASGTQDYKGEGFTLKKEGTSYDPDNKIATLKLAFDKADLADYQSRTVSLYVNRVLDLQYTLDYLPEFVENSTVDKGYYSFVKNGKIYLAKALEEGENALALNVNAGDDNIALLDLSYTCANDNAEFKKAVSGAKISVFEIGGGKIVLIEVSPATYNISTAAFGYQLKTDDEYSFKFYYVTNNTAQQITENVKELVIFNAGSCLEKGLAGYRFADTVNGTDVAFVLDAKTFGGSHKFEELADGQKCQLCGQRVTRKRITALGNVVLHDNEFAEIADNYKEGSGFTNDYNGVTIRLTAGSDWYWIRNDGYIAKNSYGEAAVGGGVWSSLGDEARTPNGKLDADGNPIDLQGFKGTMKEGAAFRIWAGYEDGTFTVIWRLYRKEDASSVTGYSDRVYFEFTHKISGIGADSVTVAFGLDDAENAGNTGNFWTFTDPGTIKNDIIKELQGDGIDLIHGSMVNGFATVTATGGNAKDLTQDNLTAIGVGDMYDMLHAAGYIKYTAFAITLKEDFSLDDSGLAEVFTDASFKNKAANAFAMINGDQISMLVALKEGEEPATYYVWLKDALGSTKQCNLKVNLSAVSRFATKASITQLDAEIVTGGEVVIEYTDLEASLSGYKFSINGVEAALAAEMTFAGVGTAEWEVVGTTGTLTLLLDPQITLDGVPEYLVTLLNGNGEKVAASLFELTEKPSLSYVDENIFFFAMGNKFYVYLFEDAATGVSSLTFNANNASTARDRILNYSLEFSLNGKHVAFKQENSFVSGKYFESGTFKVTQFVIDLNYFAITENAAYLFELYTEAPAAGTYYKVSEPEDGWRDVELKEETPPSNKAVVLDVSCLASGTLGYKAENDLGYYALEAVAGGHVFPENGGLCTRCGNVTGWKKEGIQVGAADNSTAWTFENGENKAYNPANLTDRFSAILPKQKVIAEGVLTTAALSNNWHGIAALLYPGYKFTDGTHLRIDSWINNGGNPNVEPIYGLNFAKANSENFDAMRTIRENANITITWDWTDTSKIIVTIKVVGIDVEGTFWVTYTLTPVSGNSFASQYSIGIAPDRGCFKGSIMAVANKNDVAAENCNPEKHVHNYMYDEAHEKCWCGDQNPEHTHRFTNNGYCAIDDGAFCPHDVISNNECSVCHATISATEDATLNSVENYWNNGTYFCNIAKNSAKQYKTVSFEATYATCTGWAGIGFQLKDGNDVLYHFRHDGAFIAPGKDWNAVQNDNKITETGNTGGAYTRTNYTIKGWITFDKFGVLKIYIEHWNGATKVDYREFAISNLAKDSYTINIGMDTVNSSSINGGITYRTTTASWS